jgi:hypothetical protein
VLPVEPQEGRTKRRQRMTTPLAFLILGQKTPTWGQVE